ncbi:putative alpha-amylase [Helianthus anomalus]
MVEGEEDKLYQVRILCVQFLIPYYVRVSKDCRHLLSHIFVANIFKVPFLSKYRWHDMSHCLACPAYVRVSKDCRHLLSWFGGHWPFPRDKLMQGYAYILTHPGTHVIFYDHFYDFGLRDVITGLIEA